MMRLLLSVAWLSLALLGPLAAHAGENASDDGASSSADYWVLVLEPTEAYANADNGLWRITDDVIWLAHVGEWYEVLAVIINADDEDWILAIREDDPEEVAVWLVINDRIDLLVDPDADSLCGGLVYFRCLGRPLEP